MDADRLTHVPFTKDELKKRGIRFREEPDGEDDDDEDDDEDKDSDDRDDEDDEDDEEDGDEEWALG